MPVIRGRDFGDFGFAFYGCLWSCVSMGLWVFLLLRLPPLKAFFYPGNLLKVQILIKLGVFVVLLIVVAVV
jgi:hypothetical protein